MTKFLLFLFVFLITNLNSQTNWSIEEMSPMPEPVTNNAVCEGFYTGPLAVYIPYVFSFGGVDSTLSFSGIHNKSWRYTVLDNTWEQIADIPSTEKTIASSASFVNGKIYIMGGYTVESSGNEVSSNKVFVYDVANDTFLLNGANIPIATDDHVQCVYKDSLIYVVTGWSNSTNITNVQIYDTYNDTWQVGTSVPNTSDYKVFGSNGTIIGDTLYYYGGANTMTNFPASNKIKKGYINPSDPISINWNLEDYSIPNGYRMACTSVNDTIFWIGGSEISYNYNAIAYNGSGIVSPSNQIFRYEPEGSFSTDNSLELPMDIRGIASIDQNVKFLAGGIEDNGKVSNKLLKLTWRKPIIEVIEIVHELKKEVIKIQNPIENNQLNFSQKINHIQVLNIDGQLIFEKKNIDSAILDVTFLKSGIYFLKVENQIIKSLKK